MAKAGQIVKEGSVSEIASRLSEQPDFFITAVNRLPSVDTDAFRKKLFTGKSRLLMIKRRLGKRAVEPLKITGLAELLEGSVGLVFSGDDPLQTAKLIVEFRKTREERLMVLGAVIDGQLLDKARVEQLAALPPKPVLLTQVVFTVESLLSDVIFTLEQLIGDVAWLAEQAAAAKPAEAPNAAEAAAPSAAPATAPEAPAQPGPTPTEQQTPKPEEGTPA